MKRLALAALLLFAFASPAAAQDAGVAAYQAGNYDEALRIWLPAAREGNAAAQTNMGVLWRDGLTAQTPRNQAEASQWFGLAAQQGYSPGMLALADLQWQNGYRTQALSWINLAASRGDNTARNVLTSLGQPLPPVSTSRDGDVPNRGAPISIASPNYFGGGYSIASPNYFAPRQSPDALDRALPSLNLGFKPAAPLPLTWTR